MGKNANNSLKKPVGLPAIVGAIAGLIVLLVVCYFIFLRPSDSVASHNPPPAANAPSDAATAAGGAPNMPQPPPADTDKEHIGPDTSGAPR